MARDTQQVFDIRDLRAGLLIGVAFGLMKFAAMNFPSWNVSQAVGVVPCALALGYIVYRARREPERLDAWGLTQPMTPLSWLAFLLMLSTGVATLAGTSYVLHGAIPFRVEQLFSMIAYIVGAFPQQFFLCSVGLSAVAALPIFKGNYRLPITVGILFGLAHFWSPSKFPGTMIPVQLVITMPLGFVAAYYFLRFRNLMPLVICHAVFYPIYHDWIERHL